MKYPDLFQKWKNHDLKFRHEFESLYERLKEEDEEKVWLFIEEFYLDRYSGFISVWFDLGSTGLWRIPFPGSEDKGPMVEPDFISLPADMCEKLKAWRDYLNENSRPWENNDPCEYEKANRWGMEVAKEIRRVTSPSIYIEYNPFRELVIEDGEVVELDVPEFITKLCNG